MVDKINSTTYWSTSAYESDKKKLNSLTEQYDQKGAEFKKLQKSSIKHGDYLRTLYLELDMEASILRDEFFIKTNKKIVKLEFEVRSQETKKSIKKVKEFRVK